VLEEEGEALGRWREAAAQVDDAAAVRLLELGGLRPVVTARRNLTEFW
jgi:hypothetical protein